MIIGRTTDGQRQQFAEGLVYATVFVVAGYKIAKNKGDANQVKIFRQLAGHFLNSVLKIEPSKLALTDAGLSRLQ